ncbi:hypothetical protein CVO77_07335 [Sphingopyxis lindanitolerans]|uniref:17 kDa surface antigen n=1 Tax=Sphingopyxis lindanitolerans TaxID=2054227 RepID=A0A2S8B7L2_9SPHN|nr:hypothetical protein [Sphingopyxis lindanitolerans]PQM28303.1 hypothetical protein CVO77_07335 [Sphingopyxis lindanitolerans]
MAMKASFTKAAIGAATAGAMLMSAVPANARDRHDRDGISAGEIIAGAVVIGGLAAILSASDNDRYNDRYGDRYDGRYNDRYRGRYDNDPRYGYGYDYNRYGNSRSAVSQCVNAVERGSSRYGRTDVTQVTSIDRKRDGYKVKGRVVVRDGYGGRWGRGGSYDKGKFSCDIRYGRVVDVDYSGLR